MRFERIIIGAGLYGMYAAVHCAKKGLSVMVLECENSAFTRATYINQARVHMGYHYPRSMYTAMKSAGYFNRFNEDFGFCINSSFDQIYATSKAFSWTGAEEFKHFCKNVGIKCEELGTDRYFREGMCDGAFLTREYTYDAQILKEYFLDKISRLKNITIKYNADITEINHDGNAYYITASGEEYETGYVLNASYASVNQILKLAGFDCYDIKYELCEIILCSPSEALSKIGITVMDGPFFSIMPFGKTGLHSLTTVTRTPHDTCYELLPRFDCQNKIYCSPEKLGNCDFCENKPATSWKYMSSMAEKYLKDEYSFKYHSSRFSMKPILKASEIDDSRPTSIKVMSEKPFFVSVLSGKINTVYDLEEYL